VTQLFARVTLPIVLLIAAFALVVSLATGSVVAFQVAGSTQSQATPKAKKHDAATAADKQHPCNHGFYVSQAAHAKKGGAYVSAIAQSELGKDGTCTAPLPASAAKSKKPKSSSTD
jgi:hypothetical protein